MHDRRNLRVLIQGCTDPSAVNFEGVPTEDDGSCIYFNQSTPPLVQITTESPILDDLRIVANMKVLNSEDGLNFLSDTTYEYDGQISIEIRGSSSQFFPKQSYAPKPKILLEQTTMSPCWACRLKTTGSSMDRIQTNRSCGTPSSMRWETKSDVTPPVVGIANCTSTETTEVYMLMENIKRDDDRVDIATLLPSDTAGNELTGGYIRKWTESKRF